MKGITMPFSQLPLSQRPFKGKPNDIKVPIPTLPLYSWLKSIKKPPSLGIYLRRNNKTEKKH